MSPPRPRPLPRPKLARNPPPPLVVPQRKRRSMIFGDDESFSPTIPALTPSEQQAANPAASVGGAVDAGSEGAPVDESTTQQPTRGSVASYSFEDQDKAERPRRRSVLTADEDTLTSCRSCVSWC